MRHAQRMDEEIQHTTDATEQSPPNWEAIGERIRRAATVAATVHLIESAGGWHRLKTGATELKTGATATLETSLLKSGG